MLVFLFSIALFSWIILRWPFFFHRGIPSLAIIIVLLVKTFAGYLSFQYHSIYFAGGDGAIYLNSGYDLVNSSNGDVLRFVKLFLNLNRGIPEWENVYDNIIYWDSNSAFNIINDNRNAIRVNALVSIISFNNFAVHLLILNFLSLIGLNAIFICFERFFPYVRPFLVFIAVFLSPSILFWTSGILKETHTIFFLGLYLLSLNLMIREKSPKFISFFLISAFLLVLSRTFFAAGLIASTLFLLLNLLFQITGRKQILTSLSIYLGILVGTFYFFGLESILIDKQREFILIGQNANSYFTINTISSVLDILLNIPTALINVIIQPQLLSFDSFLYIFPVIENFDILFLLILSIIYRRKTPSSSFNYLVFLLLAYLLSSALIGLTVPIQGAISRYRSIAQPFLIMALFLMIDWERINEKYINSEKVNNLFS